MVLCKSLRLRSLIDYYKEVIDVATKLKQKVFYIDGEKTHNIDGIIEGFVVQGPIGLQFYINQQIDRVLQTGLTGVFQMNGLEDVFVITIAKNAELKGERVLVNYLDQELEDE